MKLKAYVAWPSWGFARMDYRIDGRYGYNSPIIRYNSSSQSGDATTYDATTYDAR
jgi:hypothetical protein